MLIMLLFLKKGKVINSNNIENFKSFNNEPNNLIENRGDE